MITAAVAGVALAAAMWWAYFDVGAILAARALVEAPTGQVQNEMARDAYSYLHYPIVAGIVLVALGPRGDAGPLLRAPRRVARHRARRRARALLPRPGALQAARHRRHEPASPRRHGALVALIPVATRVPALVAARRRRRRGVGARRVRDVPLRGAPRRGAPSRPSPPRELTRPSDTLPCHARGTYEHGADAGCERPAHPPPGPRPRPVLPTENRRGHRRVRLRSTPELRLVAQDPDLGRTARRAGPPGEPSCRDARRAAVLRVHRRGARGDRPRGDPRRGRRAHAGGGAGPRTLPSR